MRRLLVVIALLLAIVAGIGYFSFRSWSNGVHARLQERLDVIRAAGEPTTMEELAAFYPAPPEGENAAELLERAFEKFVPAEDREFLEKLPLEGRAKLPADTEPIAPEMLTAIRQDLAANAEALALLHEALARPTCRFDVDFSRGVHKAMLSHLSRLRRAAALLALEAIEHTEQGRLEEAVRSLVACLHVGRALRYEPIQISSLVGLGFHIMAARQMQRLVSRVHVPPALLRQMGAELAAAADPTLVRRLLVAERCATIDWYDRLFIHPQPDAWEGVEGGEDALKSARWAPKAYFKLDLIEFIDLFNAMIDAAGKPYPQSLRLAVQVHFDEPEGANLSWYHGFSRMLYPSSKSGIEGMQKHMARLDSARAALAVLRCREERNGLPSDLSALVPDFLDAVPPDPFSGEKLLYRATEDGFVIYSVGENGEDDGGDLDAEPKWADPPDLGFQVRWPKAKP